ncbi:hypothetical protein JXA56_01655 [Candidatus Micrarchaeota archaeon]|nr:hypothetical protein [Candidatus Micrarchaeota archaeon]
MRYLILVLILIILAAMLPVIIIIGPQLDFSLVLQETSAESEVRQPIYQDSDTARYFYLKNQSCTTLSGDFYIITTDITTSEIHGLMPSSGAEEYAALAIAESFNYRQTTRTYVRGDSMKLVEGNKTTIWKNNRIYECNSGCTMRIMTDEDSESYSKKIHDIRENCRYFGRTELPYDISEILSFEKTGTKTINGNKCDNFLITPKNLPENSSIDIIWALKHIDGSMEECLDESTGIVVYRNLTLDLTGEYLLEFEDGGYFKVNQITVLDSFSSKVPESFLLLPD